MAQQIINIGSAPNDGGGDQLRLSFNKCNDNFTELYAKGATEGLWNYNKTSTDTSTSPVSGRFRTNSGNYRDATQIAIHAITIQGIDRTSTLRALLVGDSIQCQDSTNSAAWCRYSLQSLPVDHGTWFQLNVTFQTDGGVTSGDNQEIVFVFTAGSGGSIDLSAYATLASPTFTGDPKAPTPTAGDNDISIATTAFVQDAVSNATGGAAGTAEYNFSTSTSPPPNTGDVRVNNATASAATILWISNITRLGSDIKRILQQIQVGSKLVIQDKGNSANYASFQVAGALVDQTTYWEIPVTFSVGAGTVTNNARILFGVQAPGAAGNVSNSGTPTAGQVAEWVTATTIAGVSTYAKLASPVFTGDPQAPTPTTSPADNDTSIATTAFVTTQAVPQCGRLAYVSATALSFKPFNGDRIRINGVLYAIPSAGIAGLANTGVFVNGTAGQSLAANTTYRVYAFINSGTITADFSTTAHATSATAGNVGVEIKSGDDTRTLIGIVRAAGGPPGQFFDVELGARLVRSWFNRSRQAVYVTFNASTSSTTIIVIGGGSAQFMCFAGEVVQYAVAGYFLTSSVGVVIGSAQVYIDGGAAPVGVLTVVNAYATGVYCNISNTGQSQSLAEGYHLAQLAANVNSDSATYVGAVFVTVG